MQKSTQSFELSPAQALALEFLVAWQEQKPILHLYSHSGLGKTEILKQFQSRSQAHWLDVRALVEEVANRHPLAMQDALWHVLLEAIKSHSMIIVDDFHLFFDYATGCHANPRGSYHETVAKAVLLAVTSRDACLVLASNGHLPDVFSDPAWATGIRDFAVEDYQHIFGQYLGAARVSQIDFEAVFRFAPNLNIYRIQRICDWLKPKESVSTDELLDFIQSQGMASNVQVSEVQEVELTDLCGVDEVVTALEDNIITPMENIRLATQLGLTPKRGVMLAGPPGTGKTTVGRALARRLRGKFFLIDGTIISGTDYFYHHINSIFHMAIANAPSIVFIDDSDVIFESGREHGLYRYLLTMLDGLESKSANNVCVMMTAMDLGNIPPALVRSGRIELWLQMKLPDRSSRLKLFQNLMADKVQLSDQSAWDSILSATEGFSGADLKRLVQDAKLLLAADITRNREVGTFENYLKKASESIKKSQSEYARSAKLAMDANANRPRWFNVHPELFGSQASESQ